MGLSRGQRCSRELGLTSAGVEPPIKSARRGDRTEPASSIAITRFHGSTTRRASRSTGPSDVFRPRFRAALGPTDRVPFQPLSPRFASATQSRR